MKKIKFALVLVAMLVVSLMSTTAFALSPTPNPVIEPTPAPKVEVTPEPMECPNEPECMPDVCTDDEPSEPLESHNEPHMMQIEEEKPICSEMPAREKSQPKAERPEAMGRRMENLPVAKAVNAMIPLDEALSYIETHVRMNGIYQLHFFGCLTTDWDDKFCLEVFVPEMDENFFAKVIVPHDGYMVPTRELNRIVDDIFVAWHCAPVDLYSAVKYMGERLSGIYAESVYGNISIEGEDVYFDFCIVREDGCTEVRFVQAHVCGDEYNTTYDALDQLGEKIEYYNDN